MENLELRIRKLERKYSVLRSFMLVLAGLAAYAGFSGTLSINRSATAQEEDTGADTPVAAREAGLPVVVEAQVFILRDSGGTIRGVWSADEESTSLALMHKGKYPIIAMSVDNRNASLSLTDVYKGKISLSLNNSLRSIAIADDTGRNNLYMGLTGAGEASFDMVSTGSTSLVLDGSTSSIDMTGDNTILAMAETVGSTVALKAQPASSALTFLDHQGTATLDLSTVDGRTQMKMKSPATKDEKTVVTTPEEILALSSALARPYSGSQEERTISSSGMVETPSDKDASGSKAKAPVDNKPVDMKTYSPFASSPEPKNEPKQAAPSVYSNEKTPSVYSNEKTPSVYSNEKTPSVYSNEKTPSVYSNEKTPPKK